MPKINLQDYLPLNTQEAIDRLLQYAECFHVRLNEDEIGEVLQNIRKIKLQLYFRMRIDELNAANQVSYERMKEICSLRAETGHTRSNPKKKKPKDIQEYADGADSYEEALDIEQQISSQEQPYYSDSNDVWKSSLAGSYIIKIPMGGMNKYRLKKKR